MFFPERITMIRPGDKVLEIGPGADPHPRSDVLLEMEFTDPVEYRKQFGHERPLATDKELVLYDGHTFPFEDGAFDYVICSHVVEHVPDVDHFVREIFRVGRRGYFEYPLCYYEYLYNFDVHLNYVKFNNGVLYHMKKTDTPLEHFRPVQEFFAASLAKGYSRTLNDMLTYFMEGFEWDAPFPIRHATHLGMVCHSSNELPPLRLQERPLHTYGPKRLLRELLRSIRLRGSY